MSSSRRLWHETRDYGKIASGMAEEAFGSHIVRTRIGEGGRLVIPAHLRRRLGLAVGDDALLIETRDGELRLTTPEAGLRHARALVRRYVKPSESLVEELLAERRQEARRER